MWLKNNGARQEAAIGHPRSGSDRRDRSALETFTVEHPGPTVSKSSRTVVNTPARSLDHCSRALLQQPSYAVELRSR
jgi:hypothetical protein